MRAGHDVVRERDRPFQCCLVLEGWLYRYKMLEDGSRQIFAFHIPGDIPDLQSLHLKIMDHNLAALVASTVGMVTYDSVRQLIRKFPHLGDILWRDTLIDGAPVGGVGALPIAQLNSSPRPPRGVRRRTPMTCSTTVRSG